jgi:hypothetical protein
MALSLVTMFFVGLGAVAMSMSGNTLIQLASPDALRDRQRRWHPARHPPRRSDRRGHGVRGTRHLVALGPAPGAAARHGWVCFLNAGSVAAVSLRRDLPAGSPAPSVLHAWTATVSGFSVLPAGRSMSSPRFDDIERSRGRPAS